MAPKATPQLAMDERVIDDRDLEKALEDREIAKGAVSEARSKYNGIDEAAKGLVAQLSLKDGDVVRVGRFRLSQRRVAAKSVAFETDARDQLYISLAEADG